MTQKRYLHIIFTFLVFGLLTSCKVQNKTAVSKNALSQKSNEKETQPYITAIKTDYILKDSSTVVLFLSIDFENLESSGINSIEAVQKKFRTNWAYNPATGIKEKLASGRFIIDNSNASLNGNLLLLEFEIPRLKIYTNAVLALEFIDLAASRKFTNESLIDFNGERPNHRYGMFLNDKKRPTFDAYVLANSKIVFKSINQVAKKLYLKRYISDIPAALSPMSTSKRNEFSTFQEKETISITTGKPIYLENEGTYVLFDDSLRVENGYGFLVVNERYPRLTKEEELIEPLIYMSTNDEINGFKEKEELKKALDLYFLAMTSGNQSLAKQIIKSYYRRVEKANKLFTTYKEGWKTDKGMIYLILGPPSRIQRNGQREVWLYAQSANFSEIIFTFYRKQNQFSEDHYELVRYPEYGAYWYPFVEAWRTGSVLE
jgi:GWxTD domain-containing protein